MGWSGQKLNSAIAVIGIIGKNSFHLVGHDKRGGLCCGGNGREARSKRGLLTCKPCLIGMDMA
jgi:transposase